MSKSNPENLDPITGAPGAHALGTGLGAAGGAAAGAAVGSTAGPLGTIAGGVVGAIAGGLAGKEIAENANPTEAVAAGDHELADVAVASGEAELVNPQLANAIADHHLAEGLGVGGGAVVGAAAGAPGGPVGIVAGAAVGAVAGVAIGNGTAKLVDPKAEELHWRDACRDRPYYDSALGYDDYRPAYELGYRTRAALPEATFDQAERRISQDWAMAKGESRLTWEQAKLAARDAWDRATD